MTTSATSFCEANKMNHAEYIRRLRPLLPKEAFQPEKRKLLPAALHLSLIVSGWIALRYIRGIYVPLVSLGIGNSLVCLGFLAHETSHRVVVRNPKIRYKLELLFWGLNLIPATMWIRLHNESHHAHTNTIVDPDRRFLLAEKNSHTIGYATILYPNRYLRFSIICLFQFIFYIARNLVSVFTPGRKLKLNSFTPKYTAGDKRTIAVEILFIFCIQGGIFLISGSHLKSYFFAGLAPVLVTSIIGMSYIFTNHFLNPIGNGEDPLASTTSVIVPRWIDNLHLNFSYHTEHHLFPTMNSKYYPFVKALLQQHFPSQYNRLKLSDAWHRLWSLDLFAEFEEASKSDSSKFFSTK